MTKLLLVLSMLSLIAVSCNRRAGDTGVGTGAGDLQQEEGRFEDGRRIDDNVGTGAGEGEGFGGAGTGTGIGTGVETDDQRMEDRGTGYDTEHGAGHGDDLDEDTRRQQQEGDMGTDDNVGL
jgi:hypothetical protein